MAYHNDLGKLGEQLAVDYLSRKGFIILERNFIYDKAELDIIAKKEKKVIVVEVKTRNSNFFGAPQDFVTPAKIKLMVKAANEYVLAKNIDLEVRFDIVAILKNQHVEKIEHIKNAFYHF